MLINTFFLFLQFNFMYCYYIFKQNWSLLLFMAFLQHINLIINQQKSYILNLKHMQRKYEKTKSKLSIVVPQSQKNIYLNAQQTQEIYVKPMYSMKNSRKVPIRFNFDQEKVEMMRLRKSKKLQKQKDILLSSLGALKVGAVSAIAEKQEQIDQLKSQLGWQQVKQLENEIQQLIQEGKQLKNQINQLEEKLYFERQGYTRLLQQKDKVIEELYVQLQSIQLEIEKLQKFQQMKEKKIKIIQQQNNYLFCQLQQEKIAHIKQHYQTTEGLITVTLNEQEENQQRNYQQGGKSNKTERSREQREYLCLSTIEAKHQQQLKQLTSFYQRRIAQMRQIYEKELHLWPYSKQSSLQNQLMENVPSLNQTNVAVPNKLSNQITLQSDCYSNTKRGQSKADNKSIYISDKNSVDLNLRFFKRIANTPASQTTMSIRKAAPQKFAFTQAKKQNETQISEDKNSQKQPSLNEKKQLKYFMIGALAGGACTFLISYILPRIK